MTLPEVLLWQRIRGSKTGGRFRRQHPIGPYIVDFYCPSHKLAVEVDGEAHSRGERPERDAERDTFLKQNGHRVVRIVAADVLRDPDLIAQHIASIVARPLHQPLAGPPPRSGEELEGLP